MSSFRQTFDLRSMSGYACQVAPTANMPTRNGRCISAMSSTEACPNCGRSGRGHQRIDEPHTPGTNIVPAEADKVLRESIRYNVKRTWWIALG